MPQSETQEARQVMGRRAIRVWTYVTVGLGGAFLLMLAPFLLGPADDLSPAVRILSFTVAAAATAGWGFVIGTLLFRRYDEFKREGSKYAWYWGASGGIALSAPLYVFIALGGLHWVNPEIAFSKEMARAFMGGYSLLLFTQMFGFMVVAIWWRVTRR